jgi:hypothetical protein
MRACADESDDDDAVLPPCSRPLATDDDADAVLPRRTHSPDADDGAELSSAPSDDGGPSELPLHGRRSRPSTRGPDDDADAVPPWPDADDDAECASLPPSHDADDGAERPWLSSCAADAAGLLLHEPCADDGA